MSCQTSPVGLEFFRFIMTAILVVIGWIVVNALAVRRERDKSRREMIADSADSICESIDKLFEDSNEYHTTERNKKLETKIKIEIGDISQRINSMSQICVENDCLPSCSKSFLELKQSITLQHFEDEHDGAIHSNIILESIASSSLKLKRDLVQLKHAQFPPPVVYR